MLQAFAALVVSLKPWTMRTGNGTESSQADTPVDRVRWQSYIISQQGMFHHNHQIHRLTGAESFARVSVPWRRSEIYRPSYHFFPTSSAQKAHQYHDCLEQQRICRYGRSSPILHPKRSLVSATLFMSIEICGGRAWCLFEFIWGVNWRVRCASKELCVKLVWFLCLCRHKPLGIGLIWEYLYSPTPSSLPNLPKLMLLYFLEIIKKTYLGSCWVNYPTVTELQRRSVFVHASNSVFIFSPGTIHSRNKGF